MSLAYGANDMGSVMIEENVVRAAGASYCMDEIEIVRNIENAGFAAKRRNMHYEILGDPIFREREVPRMLELAVARADGDTSRAPEIDRYAARSAGEKRLRQQGHRPRLTAARLRRRCIHRSRTPMCIARRGCCRSTVAAHSATAGLRCATAAVTRARCRTEPADAAATPRTLRSVAILPGLVNAHAHLELSWMRGLVPPGDSMPAWASALIALRRSADDRPVPRRSWQAIARGRAAGTTLVGDVANTDATYRAAVEQRALARSCFAS